MLSDAYLQRQMADRINQVISGAASLKEDDQRIGKIYLFDQNKYSRYNLDIDRVDNNYPLRIGIDGWFRLWQDGVDAAVRHPRNRKFYFFRGSQYTRSSA